MKFKQLLTKTLLVAVGLLAGQSVWGDAPVSGSDYLIKNVQTGYYLVGGIDWGTHACLRKMPQWFTFTGSNGVYTLDSHQFNNNANSHFLNTSLYVDGATTNWTVTETATSGVFTIENDGNYLVGNGIDVAITTTTDGTAAAAQWQLISRSDFVNSLSSATAANGVDATPYIKDPELKRNGNYTTYSGTKPWSITGYDGTGSPSNFSQGNNGNNASCSESLKSTNGFKVAQTLTGLKPGVYKLTAQAFYRQDGSDNENLPYLFVNDAKSNISQRTGTENSMVEAYTSFLNGTYPVTPITFVVSSESENFTIGYANANTMMWNIFGQTQLTYYGTCLGSDAIAFTNGGTMTAGQWYYFDATVADTYKFTASSDIAEITYTTDGIQLTETATGSALTATQVLDKTRYYFKSNTAQTLTIDVPTGAEIVNADIDYSNPIVEGSVAGAVNSMTFSGSNFELGYTSGNPAVTVNGDVLRVGNGTGTVTIPTAQYAGTRDEVVLTFDYYFGNLNGSNAGFYLYDASSKEIGGLYISKYDNTEVTNTFNVDRSQITAVGSSKASNIAILAATNKTSFEIHLNYATGTMYLKQSTNGTLKQTTTPVPMVSTKPLASFVIKTNYGNTDRRCWFDNLTIYTVKGDYSVSDVGYTVKFVDGDGATVKTDVTDRESAVGTAISTLASSDDQITFYNDGDIANNTTVEFAGATNKYVYKSVSAVNSSDEEITELEAGAIVTIVYDKYNKYDYAMKQKLGTADATNLHVGSLWEDQTVTYYYPVCVKDGDNYYVTVANGSTPKFGKDISSKNPNPVINYTLDERIVYYAEAENMGGSRYKDSQVPSLASNGTAYCSAASSGSYQVTNWEGLAAGNYDIEVGMGSRGYSVSPAPQLKSGAEAEATATLEEISLGASSHTVKEYKNQPIAAGDQLFFYNDNGSNASKWALDYVILRSIPTSVTATITKTGYATFSSPYALDFSNPIDGLTAYYASAVKKGEVTMTELTQAVPAETGLYLEGTANQVYSIPVAAEGTALPGKNFLKPNTTDTDIAGSTDGTYHYVYAYFNDGDLNAGFYNLASTTQVPAGKAYLESTTDIKPEDSGSASAKLAVVFANPTGISNVDASESINTNADTDKVYNLSGQLVGNGYKGIVIKNGKKYNQ